MTNFTSKNFWSSVYCSLFFIIIFKYLHYYILYFLLMLLRGLHHYAFKLLYDFGIISMYYINIRYYNLLNSTLIYFNTSYYKEHIYIFLCFLRKYFPKIQSKITVSYKMFERMLVYVIGLLPLSFKPALPAL